MSKIAFVFPGQGSQHVGMGLDLYKHHPQCKEIFEQADQRLSYRLSRLMFEGPEEDLKLTENAQPALVTTSIACYQLLKEHGITPDVVAGNSLGEYAALVAASAMSFEDAVWLVQKRGKYMQEAVPAGEGGMVALLGLDQAKAEKLCAHCSQYGVVEVANFNCPGQIVVSGDKVALDKVLEVAKDFGARRAVALPVSGPFHSSLLKPAGKKLAEAIKQISIDDPKLPVFANITAKTVDSAKAIEDALIEQVSGAVMWEQTIREMVELGVDTIIEVGSGKVLSGLTKKIAPQVKILNVEDTASLEKTLEALQV